MARIAFCECGWTSPDNSAAAETTPVNGWWMLAVPSAIAPDNTHSVGFLVEDLRRMYWNIQAMTLAYDLVATPDTGDPITISGSQDMVAAFDRGEGTPAADELDLVRFKGDIGFFCQDTTADYDLLFQMELRDIYFDASGSPPTNPYWVFFINLTSPTSLTIDAVGGFPSSGVSITSNESFLEQPMFQIDGVNPVTWSGTISLTVTNWWSYDGVFDPTDGSQLLSPPPQGL